MLDWVPAHFCKDDHGLRLFDGTPLYEGMDPAGGEAAMGNARVRFRQTEVQSFLLSNAVFWLDVFHIDGLRVDAVASMIGLEFG